MAKLRPFTFISEAYSELTHVVWPTRSEAIRKTVVIVLAILIGGGLIGALDYGLSQGIRFLLAL